MVERDSVAQAGMGTKKLGSWAGLFARRRDVISPEKSLVLAHLVWAEGLCTDCGYWCELFVEGTPALIVDGCQGRAYNSPSA
jgi:hypothetical protein